MRSFVLSFFYFVALLSCLIAVIALVVSLMLLSKDAWGSLPLTLAVVPLCLAKAAEGFARSSGSS